jgi:hypothetical protein
MRRPALRPGRTGRGRGPQWVARDGATRREMRPMNAIVKVMHNEELRKLDERLDCQCGLGSLREDTQVAYLEARCEIAAELARRTARNDMIGMYPSPAIARSGVVMVDLDED